MFRRTGLDRHRQTRSAREQQSFTLACTKQILPFFGRELKCVRHRINRGGDRRLNRALHMAVVTRMRMDPRTRAYVERRTKEGKSKREAIEEAAGIRLRPILMTTAAMVLGVVPLIMATGAGAESRYQMGLVIATGLGIGTLSTLFVVPAVYMLIGADHSRRHLAEDETLAEALPGHNTVQ